MPTRPNPLLPIGAPVVQPSAVTLPSGTRVEPNGITPNRMVGEQLPQPRSKPMKLNLTKTNPLKVA